jgi:hypothetical protein
VVRQLIAATISPLAKPCASAVLSAETKRSCGTSSRSLAYTFCQSASFMV